jgi:hypothetical protein
MNSAWLFALLFYLTNLYKFIVSESIIILISNVLTSNNEGLRFL